MALPAAAIEPEEVFETCEEWLLNHEDDPEWEWSCDEAIRLWASQETEPPGLPIPEYPPSGPFPIEETAIPAGPHDGDLDAIVQALQSGPADIIVEFEVSAVRDDIHRRAVEEGLRFLDDAKLAEKRAAYASIKLTGLAGLVGVVILQDYENLPTSFVRLLNEAALNSLIARPEIKAVYENRAFEHSLAQSLPLIHQPDAATEGLGGAGTTIAVLDTGVDFRRPEFGSCTSPGIPMGCRVVDTFEAAENDFSLDDSGHGTNVSAIAAATAGEADLAVADVFTGTSAFENHIKAAINWAIAIRSTFNIVAMNMSFGFPTRSPSPCTTDAFAAILADTLAAGIRPIASSGNRAFVGSVYSDGISPPACVPSAVSVGAVYDANSGFDPVTWCNNPTCTPPHQCTDATTAANQIACLSQSASYLSLLAPGAFIIAGGTPPPGAGGTSQAAPHVAGAWAMMRAVSNLSEGRLLATLQEIGDPRTDTRPDPDRTTSRLDLLPEPGQLLQLAAGILALSGLRRVGTRRR